MAPAQLQEPLLSHEPQGSTRDPEEAQPGAEAEAEAADATWPPNWFAALRPHSPTRRTASVIEQILCSQRHLGSIFGGIANDFSHLPGMPPRSEDPLPGLLGTEPCVSLWMGWAEPGSDQPDLWQGPGAKHQAPSLLRVDPERGACEEASPRKPLEPTAAAPTARPAAGAEEEGGKALSVAEATFMMVNYVLNFGVFSVPFVFAMGGYTALALIGLAGFACTFTGKLIGEVLETLTLSNTPCSSYGDIARAAAGPGLATVVQASGLLEMFFYGIGNAIVLAHTFDDLVPWLNFDQAILLSTGLTLALSAIPDKAYSYLALLSAAALSISCGVVLASGWQLPEWARSEKPVGEISQLPTGLSMLIFGAACHPMLPSIYQGTRSRADFDRATRNGWLVWTGYVALFGAFTYYMFGDAVQVIATLNIGKGLDMQPLAAAGGFAAFSAVWVVVKLQGSQVPATRPIVEALASAVGVRLPQGNGGLTCVLVSAPVLLSVAAAASLLQNRIAMLEKFAASFLMSFNAFIFPAFAYIQVVRPESAKKQAYALASAAFGMALTVAACC